MKKSDVFKTVVCIDDSYVPIGGKPLKKGEKYKYWLRNSTHIYLIIYGEKYMFGYSESRFK